MPIQFSNLHDILNHGFAQVIDVRSPAEFADDHVPGAINLPALSNEERAEVGTLYKQVSPFLARKKGAALVLGNIATHLNGPLASQSGDWRPLVYCWRGGQRSGVFSTLLREIGWRAETIKGGYQSYRRIVQHGLYEGTLPHHIVLLDGNTGTAKTALLPLVAARGVQVLDLEGLANHRGSLIGAMQGAQPSQRQFESALAAALLGLDPAKPLLVEAESSKIGRINLPPALWTRMLAAPRIEVTAPVSARAAYLARAYDGVLRDVDTVRHKLAPLRRLRGHQVVDQWQSLQDRGDYLALAEALVTDHYDPAYAKSRRARDQGPEAKVAAASLDAAALEELADEVARAVTGIELPSQT